MKNTPKTTTWKTVNALANETGSDSRHVRRWLELDSVQSRQEAGRTVYEPAAALEAIQAHKRRPGNVAASPESTAFQPVPWDSYKVELERMLRFEALHQRVYDDKTMAKQGFTAKQVAWLRSEVDAVLEEA